MTHDDKPTKTGEVVGKCLPRHRSGEFLTLLKKIEKLVPRTSTRMWSAVTIAPTRLGRRSLLEELAMSLGVAIVDNVSFPPWRDPIHNAQSLRRQCAWRLQALRCGNQTFGQGASPHVRSH